MPFWGAHPTGTEVAMPEAKRTQETPGIRVMDNKLEKATASYLRGSTGVDEVVRVIRSKASEKTENFIARVTVRARRPQ